MDIFRSRTPGRPGKLLQNIIDEKEYFDSVKDAGNIGQVSARRIDRWLKDILRFSRILDEDERSKDIRFELDKIRNIYRSRRNNRTYITDIIRSAEKIIPGFIEIYEKRKKG